MTHLSPSVTPPFNAKIAWLKLINGSSVCTGVPVIVAVPVGASPVMRNSAVNGVALLIVSVVPVKPFV